MEVFLQRSGGKNVLSICLVLKILNYEKEMKTGLFKLCIPYFIC